MLAVINLALRLAFAYAARRLGQAAGLFAAGVVFAIIALIGFAAALWVWLAHVLGPIPAALLVAASGFVLALACLLAARAKLRSASPLQSPAAQRLIAEIRSSNADTSLLSLLGPALAAALLGLLAGKPKE